LSFLSLHPTYVLHFVSGIAINEYRVAGEGLTQSDEPCDTATQDCSRVQNLLFPVLSLSAPAPDHKSAAESTDDGRSTSSNDQPQDSNSSSSSRMLVTQISWTDTTTAEDDADDGKDDVWLPLTPVQTAVNDNKNDDDNSNVWTMTSVKTVVDNNNDNNNNDNSDNENDDDDGDDDGNAAPAAVDYNSYGDANDFTSNHLTEHRGNKSANNGQRRQTLISTTDVQHHAKQFTGRLLLQSFFSLFLCLPLSLSPSKVNKVTA